MTNADGSEKLLVFIIGKATNHVHFKRRLVNSSDDNNTLPGVAQCKGLELL